MFVTKEFKVGTVRFGYKLERNGVYTVKVFLIDLCTWFTIGCAKSVEGAHELAKNFVETVL